MKTGNGGIRDIEFVIQFLQLLNGGDLPALRTGNTLRPSRTGEMPAASRTRSARCWRRTTDFCGRSSIAYKSCSTCKRICCPSDPDEMRKLAIRMGYNNSPQQTALARLRSRLPDQDRAEPKDSRPSAARRLRRRRGNGAGSRPGARSRPAGPNDWPKCWAGIGFRDVKLAYKNLIGAGRSEFAFCRRAGAGISWHRLRRDC